MLLPEERILFTVDFIPIQTVQFRDLPDGYLPDWFESLDRVLSLDWESMVPGHPYAGGRLGTKGGPARPQAIHARSLGGDAQCRRPGSLLRRRHARGPATQVRAMGSYKEHFPMNVQRFCEYWGRGY
jgi:glyoxylase-like metal-dependent hydrolase (beta-lactamase superfamily II)